MAHPGLDRKSFFHLFHDSVKSRGIVDRHLGKHLAVQFDAGFSKPAHEFAISQSALTSGCIDAGDPQSAEIPFSLATVAVGVCVGAYNGFLGRAKQVVSPTTKALGPFEETTFCLGARRTFPGSHSSLPFLTTPRPFPAGEALPARAALRAYTLSFNCYCY